MPAVSRVIVMDPFTAKQVDTTEGPLHIRRYDGLVHVVESGAPFLIYAWPDGTVSEPFIAEMFCGVRTKVNQNSRSRYVKEPATCIVCLAGGY